MTDVFSMPVFPAADVFPMMAPDELQELAADIKENGLREPLVLAEIPIFDEDGEPVGKELQLIDGRNRRQACRIAEVEPLTRVHEFSVKRDPEWPKAKVKRLLAETIVHKATALAVGANNLRRHMTNDARVLCAAIADREAGVALSKGGRGKPLLYGKGLGLAGISESTASKNMSLARLIAEWAPIDGRMVINGTKLFSEALAEARRKKHEFEEAEKAEAEKEKIAAERAARLEALRVRHPDLAKQVDDGMKLEDAEKEGERRDLQRANSKRSAATMIADAIKSVSVFCSEKQIEALNDYARDDDFKAQLQPLIDEAVKLQDGASTLIAFLSAARAPAGEESDNA